MKKIITYLKRSNVPMTISEEIELGCYPAKEITIQNKKKTATIRQSLFTHGDIEVSIETPRSVHPYAVKSFQSETKAITFLFNEGMFQA